MNQNKPQPPAGAELAVEIDDAVAAGVYSNLALISHSETEFVLDFIFNSPQPPKAKVRSRILTSPVHMKRFLSALQENVARYEAKFGSIPVAPVAAADGKIGFFH